MSVILINNSESILCSDSFFYEILSKKVSIMIIFTLKPGSDNIDLTKNEYGASVWMRKLGVPKSFWQSVLAERDFVPTL